MQARAIFIRTASAALALAGTLAVGTAHADPVYWQVGVATALDGVEYHPQPVVYAQPVVYHRPVIVVPGRGYGHGHWKHHHRHHHGHGHHHGHDRGRDWHR